MKRLKITVEGQVYDVVVEAVGEGEAAPAPQAAPAPAPQAAPAAPAPASTGGTVVEAPLSAVVVDIHVSVGQAVNAGDKVVTIEAMKMNTVVSAPASGTVQSIAVAKGDSVEEGATLLSLS